MFWSSLFTFSCVFAFSFSLDLNDNPHLFSFSLLLLLSFLVRCLLIHHASLSCNFIVYLVLHVCANTIWLDLFSLRILTSFQLISLATSIEAFSFNFDCYTIFWYVLHLKLFVNLSYTLQPIMCVLFLNVLHKMHLCVMALLNPMS